MKLLLKFCEDDSDSNKSKGSKPKKNNSVNLVTENLVEQSKPDQLAESKKKSVKKSYYTEEAKFIRKSSNEKIFKALHPEKEDNTKKKQAIKPLLWIKAAEGQKNEAAVLVQKDKTDKPESALSKFVDENMVVPPLEMEKNDSFHERNFKVFEESPSFPNVNCNENFVDMIYKRS